MVQFTAQVVFEMGGNDCGVRLVADLKMFNLWQDFLRCGSVVGEVVANLEICSRCDVVGDYANRGKIIKIQTFLPSFTPNM